jgi:uncharacterized protein YjlB
VARSNQPVSQYHPHVRADQPRAGRVVGVVVSTQRFDDDLAWLCDAAGFRLLEVRPADAPAHGVLERAGTTLHLEASSSAAVTAPHTVIRIVGVADEPTGSLHESPGGIRVEVVPADSLVVPDARPDVVVVAGDHRTFGVGRAGMQYADLLPGRWGGRYIVSHIRIPEGGPVPDLVHFHRVRFQLIFVKRGWVRVVYEDQGPPFVMEAGDCVLQPPEIRHRVLEASPGFEVIEVGCPADHATVIDHDLDLPTATVDPERVFDGQRFVWHRAAEADWTADASGRFESRDTGTALATAGLASVAVVRPASGGAMPAPPFTRASEFAQLVVLRGRCRVAIGDSSAPVELGDGDAVALPADTPVTILDVSADLELLDVVVPPVADARSRAGFDRVDAG